MNFFEKVFTGAKALLSQYLGLRDESRQTIHEPPYDVPPEVEYEGPRNGSQAAWADQMDEMSAVNRIYAPDQSHTLFLNIREFTGSGRVPLSSERYIFTNEGMQRVEERTATLLAGNEIASPRHIGGICVCGRPIRTSRIRPCHMCGACLCRACGRYQPLPEGMGNLPVSALVLCPAHLKEFRNQWRHWQGACPVFLPPDMSIAVLDESGGAS